MSGREKKGKAPAKGKSGKAAVAEEDSTKAKNKGGKKKGQEDDDITEEELMAARMAKLALKSKKPAADTASGDAPEETLAIEEPVVEETPEVAVEEQPAVSTVETKPVEALTKGTGVKDAAGKKGPKSGADEEELKTKALAKSAKGAKGNKAKNAEEEEDEDEVEKPKPAVAGKGKNKDKDAEEAKKEAKANGKSGKAPAKAAVEDEDNEDGDSESDGEETEPVEGDDNGGETANGDEIIGEEEDGEEEEGGGKGGKGPKGKKVDARRRKAEAEAKKRDEAAKKKAQRRVDKAAGPTQTLEELMPSHAKLGADGEVRDYPWYVELKGRNKLKNRDIVCDNFGVTLGGQVLLKENTKLSLIYGHKYGMIGRNGLGKSVMLRKISSRDPDLNIPDYIRILHVEQEVAGDDKTPLQSVLEADQEREWLLKEEKRMLGLKDKAKAPATTSAIPVPAVEKPAAPKDSEAEEVEVEEVEKSYKLADIYERLREIDSDRAEARAATILAGLGFGVQELRTKLTKEYSGGWRMRIALARALFCQPDLLLLDEPNNHLDLEACIWLENYLIDWKKTLLVVSHDSAFLNEFVDHIIHIHQKSLTTYKGDYDTYVKVRESNRRTKQRKHDAIGKKEDAMKMFIQKNQNKQGKSRAKLLDKMEAVELDTDDPTMKFSFPESGGLGPLPLKFKDVMFKYGERTIFQHLNFGIDCDSRIALVGRNGVGKSTLMNLMVGQLEATIGEIERDRHMRVARFTQHHVDQLDLTVTVMVYFKERFPGAKDQEIRQHVAKFGLNNNLPNQKIDTLSGGQKSRVAFAELAWKRPHILYLDEPSNHLDVEAIESLAHALAQFDGGVVLISHNQYLVQLVCTEIWVVGHQTVTRLEGNFSDYKKIVAKEIGLTYV